MNRTAGDVALDEHLDRNPEARHAALHDAEYAADVHRLRTVLGHLDAALSAEGLPTVARLRVESRLVADCLGTDEANARMQERTRTVRQLIGADVVRMPMPDTW